MSAISQAEKPAGLWGYYGCGNLGDDLMLQRIGSVIERSDGRAPLVLTWPEGSLPGRQVCPVRSGWTALPCFDRRSSSLGLANWLLDLRGRSRVQQALAELGVLVYGGGSILGARRALLNAFRYAHRKGVRICFYGVGIPGEVVGRNSRRLISDMLHLADLAVFRDAHSYELAQECSGASPHVMLAADPLYAFAPEQLPPPDERVGAGTAPVGIAPRASGAWASHETLTAALTGLGQALLERGIPVVLLPFSDRWDAGICREIQHRLGAPDNAVVADVPRDWEQLAGLIRGLSCTVAMPLHAMLLSTVVGTPTVPLCYALKCTEFCREMGLEELAFDLTGAGTLPGAGELLGRVSAAEGFFQGHRDQIARAVQAKREAALQAEARLAEVLANPLRGRA